jgi:ferric-dicitrate binding protein FerR (iron transport regulator)
MDPVRRARDLARRYLDGLASAAEAGELEHLLQTNPDAADAFAELSRLEADLSALFSEEPYLRREVEVLEAIARDHRLRRWRGRAIRLTLAASLLLLVGGPLLWWLGEHTALPRPGHSVLDGEVVVGGNAVDRIEDGDLLSVTGAVPALLRLSDGSRARLEPQTRVLLRGPAPGLGQWIDLLAGKGRFEVPARGEALRVDTPAGRVTAVDSDFSVELTRAKEVSWEMTPQPVLGVVVVAGLVEVEVKEEIYVVAAGESRVFGAPKALRARDAIERKTVARTLVGAVTQIKGSQLIVALRRRAVPVMETFEMGPGVKIHIDGKPGKQADLAKDMAVRLQVDDKDALIAVLAEGPTIGATVKKVGDGKITFAGGGRGFLIENDTTYPLAPTARVTIDGKDGLPSELRAGTRIMVKLSADRKSVVMILQPANRRDVPPTVLGQIKAVDAQGKSVTLTVGRPGEEQTLTLGKEVKVLIDGREGKLNDLKTGSFAVVRLAQDRTVMSITANVTVARVPALQGYQARVVAVQGNKISLQVGRRDSPREEELELANSVRVILDGKPVKVTSVTKGMLVRVVKDKDVVRTILVESPTVTGTLKRISDGKIILTSRGRDEQGAIYELAVDARAAIAGRDARPGDLKPGMQVMLRLSADGKRVLLIRTVEGIYASKALLGVVKALDAEASTITIEDPRSGNEHTLKLAKEVKVNIAGSQAKPADLKQGQTVVLMLERDGKTVREIVVRSRP